MARTRVSTPATGMSALIGLLIVVFCIAGLLVYEAWSTGRSRREIAERGLQDYAAYATWSTARTGDATLSTSLATLFRGLVGTQVSATAPMPAISVLASEVDYLSRCACALLLPADYYFRADLRTGSFSSIEGRESESTPISTGYASAKVGSYTPSTAPHLPSVAEGAEVIRVLTRTRIPATADFTVVFGRVGDSSRVIGIAPQRDTSGAMIGAFGFVASPEAYARTLIAHLWRLPRILPISVTRGMPSDSLLTALVSTPDGREIYRSSGWAPGLKSDTASLAPAGGGMRVKVALRRDALARLGRGLVPASRVPVWVGLLLLTGLLTAIILRNLQREHELTRLRADFTASVSHELRTPLSQIMLFGETLTLGRTRSETERTRAAEVIVREARRLMQLVENTLQFSRADRPEMGLSPERLRLAPAIREVIASFEPLADTRGVRIVSELNEKTAATVDRAALRQMLINLLDNALKYGPLEQTISVGLDGPQPTVVSSPAMLAPDQLNVRNVVRIWVDDEGPGIPANMRSSIWDAFVRGENESATGCGLGLAVVAELARRHQGKAFVEVSPDGVGSRFIIELPATEMAESFPDDDTRDDGGSAPRFTNSRRPAGTPAGVA